MLKQVDREETAARKAVAAQENAEVARAKAAMLAKEKENDERLHAAKKALHAATERSQAMRKQYESEIKKLQQKLDVTTGKLAASEEKASRDAVAAETRRRDALAEVNARWEADVAEREARRREETTELARLLEEARAKSSDRTSELLVRATQAEEAATAARAYSAALRDELENLKASAANASAARDREREELEPDVPLLLRRDAQAALLEREELGAVCRQVEHAVVRVRVRQGYLRSGRPRF